MTQKTFNIKSIKPFFHTNKNVLSLFLLILSTFAIYWRITDYEFVNFDDIIFFITPHIQAGLTLDGIRYIFNDPTYLGMQLALLSHMLDCHFFGMNAGFHHLTSLLIHILNTILLFIVIKKMTGAHWKSLFVASLFALHPLSVESVVWLAERRNLLCAFFWFLTILAYISYVKKPGFFRYMSILLCLILGFMSKLVIAPLPFVLLLLDYWPLKRFTFFNSNNGDLKVYKTMHGRAKADSLMNQIFRLVREKIPLIAVSISLTVLGFIGSFHMGGMITPVDTLSLKLRIISSINFHLTYIAKMFYPFNLIVIYLHPGRYPELFSSPIFPWWKTAVALLLLLSISFYAIRSMKLKPYFIVGWLWFLGALVPVNGLVQISRHSIADRYSYIPLVGLFIIIAWGIPELISQWRHRKIFLAASAIILLSFLSLITFKQVSYWKNSITLFEHALKVAPNNFVAHINLGSALDYQDRTNEAIIHFSEAVRLMPDLPEAHNNLGFALNKQGHSDEAILHLLKAIQTRPNYVDAHFNLSNALYKLNRTDEAIQHLLKVIQLKPDYAEAYNNLGNALIKSGRADESIRFYLKAIRIEKDYAEAYNNLGSSFDSLGRTEDAIKYYLKAMEIEPDLAEAYNNIGKAFYKQGRTDEAIEHFLKTIEINPDLAEVHNNLGIALVRKGNTNAAITSFKKALSINPDYTNAKMNLNKLITMQSEKK